MDQGGRSRYLWDFTILLCRGYDIAPERGNPIRSYQTDKWNRKNKKKKIGQNRME